MKHIPFSRLAILFAIVLLAGNCRKSEVSLESQAITFSISGRVLDKDNQPVGDAAVKAGSSSAVTDVNGYFRLNNVRVAKDAAYVTVNKNGYFPGSRTFMATERAVNYVSIRLIPKEITGTFSASGGGLVNLISGGSISFQPNSVVDAATNAAYSGQVSISSYYIDPTDPGFNTVMPGDLRGITASNEERGLQSFGMMAVELSNPSGQKLQLASGKSATVSFPIPPSLVGSAPASIPLWHFDETSGMWKEEGSAQKQGNFYVGIVGHFSFWNCDYPFPVITFEAIVRDQKNIPVPDAAVEIKKLSNNMIGYGRTDSSGKVRGLIPANEALQLKIFDRCRNLIHTQNIGPFGNDVNLGTITVNYLPPGTATITGVAVTCSSTPVQNGYVSVSVDGMNYRTDIANGAFSITIPRCNSGTVPANLVAIDLAAGQQGANSVVNISTGSVNAGQLSACGVVTTEFINYTINGNNFAFLPGDSLGAYHVDFTSPPTTSILGFRSPNWIDLRFKGNPGTGVFQVEALEVTHGNVKYTGTGTMNVTITEFGNPNEFVAGTMTATVSTGSATMPFTCNFRLRRHQ